MIFDRLEPGVLNITIDMSGKMKRSPNDKDNMHEAKVNTLNPPEYYDTPAPIFNSFDLLSTKVIEYLMALVFFHCHSCVKRAPFPKKLISQFHSDNLQKRKKDLANEQANACNRNVPEAHFSLRYLILENSCLGSADGPRLPRDS